MSADAADPQATPGAVEDGIVSTDIAVQEDDHSLSEGNKFQQAVAAWRSMSKQDMGTSSTDLP